MTLLYIIWNCRSDHISIVFITWYFSHQKELVKELKSQQKREEEEELRIQRHHQIQMVIIFFNNYILPRKASKSEPQMYFLLLKSLRKKYVNILLTFFSPHFFL